MLKNMEVGVDRSDAEAIRYTIEIPFPTDCAPYKIVRSNLVTGKRAIISAAQTREKAVERMNKLIEALA